MGEGAGGGVDGGGVVDFAGLPVDYPGGDGVGVPDFADRADEDEPGGGSGGVDVVHATEADELRSEGVGDEGGIRGDGPISLEGL